MQQIKNNKIHEKHISHHSYSLSVLQYLNGTDNFKQPKAEEAVKTYMSAKSKNYKPLEFGEFFSQYYSESLQKIAKTKEVIKYSIVHTYVIKDKKTVDTYFHLNEAYQVIGMNTMQEMTKLITDDLKNNPKFDSIMKGLELEMQK